MANSVYKFSYADFEQQPVEHPLWHEVTQKEEIGICCYLTLSASSGV